MYEKYSMVCDMVEISKIPDFTPISSSRDKSENNASYAKVSIYSLFHLNGIYQNQLRHHRNIIRDRSFLQETSQLFP